jgi:hypothetical protein
MTGSMSGAPGTTMVSISVSANSKTDEVARLTQRGYRNPLPARLFVQQVTS